jgi:hypothetical protein
MNRSDILELMFIPNVPARLKELMDDTVMQRIWNEKTDIYQSDFWTTRIPFTVEAERFFERLLELKRAQHPQPPDITKIVEWIKNISGITDLEIDDLEIHSYPEGLAGPGVFLFSFPKEKREKKDKEKTNKIYKINKTLPTSERQTLFDTFWYYYPRRTGKSKAFKAFCSILTSHEADSHPEGPIGFFSNMLTALKNQITEKQLATEWECFCPAWPHPTNWLNQQRWTDETKLDMEYWNEECKRSHKQPDYLRIRDRILAKSIGEDGETDFDSL